MNSLYIMCGLPFAGVSTVARSFAKATDSILISFDQEHLIRDRSERTYYFTLTMRTLALEKVLELLKTGQSVVYDDHNFSREERMSVRAQGLPERTHSYIVYVETPIETILMRRTQRKQIKNAKQLWQKDLETALEKFEIPNQAEDADLIIIEPHDDIPSLIGARAFMEEGNR